MPPKNKATLDPAHGEALLRKPSGQYIIEPQIGALFPQKGGGHYKVIRQISSDPLSNHLAFEVADPSGTKSFLKLPKIPTGVEPYDLSRLVASISSSYLAERNNNATLEELRRLNKMHQVAPLTTEVSDLGAKHAYFPFIVQDFIPGDDLIKVFQTHDLFSATSGPQRCTRPETWLLLAEKLVDTVRKLHNNQIYHGDIKPKKFIVSSKDLADATITLTDFGSSMRSLDSVVPSHVAANTFAAPELIAEKETLPDGSSDIYSIGGVLYYLATGQPPPNLFDFITVVLCQAPETWNRLSSAHNEKWKSTIHTAFSTHAEDLIKEGYEIIVKIIDKCLRPIPGERYATLERLRLAISAIQRPAHTHNLTIVSASLKIIQSDLSTLDESFHPFFRQVLHAKLQLLQKELRDMRNVHYELSGEREDLIDELVKYMSFLGPRDEYITVTVPEYWAPNNLGVNGRFLTLNKDLVRRGVHIRRLFLTTPEEFQAGSQAYDILEAHRESLRAFDKSVCVSHPSIVKGTKDKPGTIWVGCKLVKDRDRVDILRGFQYVAIWKRTSAGVDSRDSEMIAITFTLRRASESKTAALPPTSEICKVRFKEIRDARVFSKLLKFMEENPRTLDEAMSEIEETFPANKKEAETPPKAKLRRGKSL